MFDPSVGVFNLQLKSLESALAAERARSQHLEQQCGGYNAAYAHAQTQIDQFIATAAEQRASAALVQDDAVSAAVAKAEAAALAASEQAAQQCARALSEAQMHAEILLKELQQADADHPSWKDDQVRLRAAKKIKEKWRGRSRRAKKTLKFLRESMPLVTEWSQQFEKLVAGTAPPEQAHLRDLWDDQMRCLRNKSHRCRWHPTVLAWCADILRSLRVIYSV